MLSVNLCCQFDHGTHIYGKLLEMRHQGPGRYHFSKARRLVWVSTGTRILPPDRNAYQPADLCQQHFTRIPIRVISRAHVRSCVDDIKTALSWLSIPVTSLSRFVS